MGTIRHAAECVGIARETAYAWFRADEVFLEGFERAKLDFREYLEKVAFDRIKTPTGNRGSDALLSHMLNAHDPTKYKPELKREESNTRAILAALQQLATKDLTAIPAKAESVGGDGVSVEGEVVGEESVGEGKS